MRSFLKFFRKYHRKIYAVIVAVFIIMNIVLFVLNYEFNKELKETEKECKRDAFEIKLAPNDNFVFLGDSITEQYPLDELYDNLPVVNSGIGGITSGELLDRLDTTVYVYNPSKVFLLIGINDIAREVKDDEIISNIEKIIKEIHKNRPNASVYVESIYPVNKSDDEIINEGAVSKIDNKKIQKINKNIKKICAKNDAKYIDMYSMLVDKDNNLKLKYTTEGLHISDVGYLKITKILYRYLQDK